MAFGPFLITSSHVAAKHVALSSSRFTPPKRQSGDGFVASAPTTLSVKAPFMPGSETA
jgi:hypothetical protein